MRRVNLFEFVELGKGLQSAASVEGKDKPFDAFFSVFSLRETLKKIKGGTTIDFGVSSHDLDQLLSAIEGVETRFRTKDKDGKDHEQLGWSAEYDLKKAREAFENVLSAECRSAATYFVSKVGIYSTNDLVENAPHKFSIHMRTLLGTEALDQFQEAARCLSFGLFTACGFHMMRAVEYVLVSYMREICGRTFASLNTNWGAYISELDKLRSGNKRKKPSKETVDLLRQIKDNHRNPVIHAEFNLSSQEAMDIFDLGAVVMSHLAEERTKLTTMARQAPNEIGPASSARDLVVTAP